MIDDNYKPWLIEVNTNPSLCLSSPLLVRIIPQMLENVFRIAVDPLFMPPEIKDWPATHKAIIPDNIIENNKFELIFDELIEGK